MNQDVTFEQSTEMRSTEPAFGFTDSMNCSKHRFCASWPTTDGKVRRNDYTKDGNTTAVSNNQGKGM